MALTRKSSFLYGYQITPLNSSLDFKSASMGPTRMATLTLGFYSLAALLTEVKRAMQSVDPLNTYTVTADRSVGGGLENRVTISTGGAFLSLLFGSGPRAASTCATILGYTSTDKTGSLTYTSQFTSGTLLVPNLVGYNFIPPDLMKENFGSLNITSSGIKEAIVYSTQSFFNVQFKYIPQTEAILLWKPLMTWMMGQKGIEFTPDITDGNIFYDSTLESSPASAKGLGYKLTEMLPSFPFLYDTGLMKFRIRNT